MHHLLLLSISKMTKAREKVPTTSAPTPAQSDTPLGSRFNGRVRTDRSLRKRLRPPTRLRHRRRPGNNAIKKILQVHLAFGKKAQRYGGIQMITGYAPKRRDRDQTARAANIEPVTNRRKRAQEKKCSTGAAGVNMTATAATAQKKLVGMAKLL